MSKVSITETGAENYVKAENFLTTLGIEPGSSASMGEHFTSTPPPWPNSSGICRMPRQVAPPAASIINNSLLIFITDISFWLQATIWEHYAVSFWSID